MKSAPIKSSTQDHLDISDIRDDIVILRDNSAAIVIQTAAINFELLSESEQDSIIFSYAGLLNSLNFTTQVVIRSKKIDLSNYLQLITDAESHQPNPDIKRQVYQYRQFIQTIVQQNNVLEKKFYLIIPFNPLELGVKGAALGNVQRDTSHIQGFVDTVKTNLYPKRDHLIKQFARLGVKSKQLTTQELIELYFDIYNPGEVGLQKVTEAAGSYTSPIVSPAVGAPVTEETVTAPQAAINNTNLAQSGPIPETPAYQPAQPVSAPAPQPVSTPAQETENETIYAPQPPAGVPANPLPVTSQPVTLSPQPAQVVATQGPNNDVLDPDILKALDALKSTGPGSTS